MPVTEKQAGGQAEQPAGKAAAAGKATAAETATAAATTTLRPAEKPASGWVAFVGAGPGDESLLTVRAAQLLAQADLVVAGPEIGGRLAHLISAEADVTDSDAVAQDPRLLVKAARSGQLVVRLFGGDPFMFCNAAAEAAVCS